MIQAKVIADSKNIFGNRITTMVVTFPRIILAEFNTHRMFSRNSASSRAIPFKKMLHSVQSEPFVPMAFQKDHPGMQGVEYITDGVDLNEAKYNWIKAKDAAVSVAEYMSARGVTKQIVNRLLEAFMWHTVIVTATDWENFFHLRCPQYRNMKSEEGPVFRSKKDYNNYYAEHGIAIDLDNEEYWRTINRGMAEIHMMALAEAMWDTFNESTPKVLLEGQWHIPFGEDLDDIGEIGRKIAAEQGRDVTDFSVEEINIIAVKIATARCARVSYTVVGEEGKKPDQAKDIELHDRLAASGHWSPFEHCARAMSDEEMSLWSQYTGSKDTYISGQCGNFRGFVQYRKMFATENKK